MVVNSCQTSFSFVELALVALMATGDGHVLDLGSGTGTVSFVCAANGIGCTSIERDPRQAKFHKDRLENLVTLAKQAFMKPYKVPKADLISVVFGKNNDTSLIENLFGLIPKPYIPSTATFSVLSGIALKDILVRFFLCVCKKTLPAKCDFHFLHISGKSFYQLICFFSHVCSMSPCCL